MRGLSAVDHHATPGTRECLGLTDPAGRYVCIALCELAIEIPHRSADPIFVPTRQPPEHGMRDRLKLTIGAPLNIRLPHRKRPDPAVEQRAHNLGEEPLNDVAGFLVDGIEFLGWARVAAVASRTTNHFRS